METNIDDKKFRVYDNKNGYYLNENDNEIILLFNGKELYQIDNNYIYENDNYEFEKCLGYKDINGKLIYENDIIKTNYDDYGKVFYSHHFAAWRIYFFKGRKHLIGFPEYGKEIFSFINPMTIEIIGNAHTYEGLNDENKNNE